MAGTRQILQRRKAAENISKVTHTMETVSAVRYRQYYKQWVDSVDFYDSLAQLAYLLVTAKDAIEHPLMHSNDSDTNVLLVIGSDRGLCGAYNSNIYRLIDVHLKMAARFGKKLKIYANGKKVVSHLNNRSIKIEKVFDDFDEVPSAEQAVEMGDYFIDQYLNGQIGHMGVVYTRFFSPASQRAQTLTVMPVDELIDDLTTRATVIWPWELNFEDFLLAQSPVKLFGTLVSMMIRAAISDCFLEAALSEHLGRIIAMRAATDNASDMIDGLTKEYNRARQGQITGELLDIIGGTFK